MKVALVHDDLVQWGGAERVLLGISEIFPQAPIYTSLYDETNPILKKYFSNKIIVTSFLQKIPFWKELYKVFLPFYPVAFEQFIFDSYDLVISHTTRFAKSILTKPQTPHVAYCHTPPRFLWNFSQEEVASFLKPYFNFLRIYDQMTSKRVDFWLAGSKNAEIRIKKVYQVDSKILYPFVYDHFFQSEVSFKGDYFLIISRLTNYKKINLAIEVFNQNGKHLKIVGSGPQLVSLKLQAKDNIIFLESVSEKALINLIAGCTALIVASEEDFGLASLEAQAMGKPVIAYGGGGVRETVIDAVPAGRQGKTGVLFFEQTEVSLKEAIAKFLKINIKPEDCIANARKFSFKRFKKDLLEKLPIN